MTQGRYSVYPRSEALGGETAITLDDGVFPDRRRVPRRKVGRLPELKRGKEASGEKIGVTGFAESAPLADQEASPNPMTARAALGDFSHNLRTSERSPRLFVRWGRMPEGSSNG